MGSTINLTNSPSNQGAAEPAFNYEEQICKAIEILSGEGLRAGGYDRTIIATVIEVVDALKGIYRLRHQDNIFLAKAACSGIEYVLNTEVYVLIPKDDFTNEKIILWSANSINHFGPLPITSMTIHATDNYSVTTRAGEEKYMALYDSSEIENTNQNNSGGS